MRLAVYVMIWGSLIAHAAMGQPVLVSSPTTIGPLDTTITGAAGVPVPLATAEITVQSSTLTINGRHSIASLAVVDGGTVTHAEEFTFDYSGSGTDIVNGLHLIVAGDVQIDSNSAIDADGRGPPNDTGIAPGPYRSGAGGNHAGEGGGNGGQITYGDYLEPVEFGSAGGSTYFSALRRAGDGGGAIRLQITGDLIVDGTLSANGGWPPSFHGGGGAGGSIWIECVGLSGAGTVEANGSARGVGGGSGGRIAVHCSGVLAMPHESFRAVGGTPGASTVGAAGTVYLADSSGSKLRIANDNMTDPNRLESTVIDGHVIVDELEIVDGGRLAPKRTDPTLFLDVQDSALIDSSSWLSGTGRGFTESTWTSPGGTGRGGNHAGEGGGEDGPVYGDFYFPSDMGSGGGGTFFSSYRRGGDGGGAIRLRVAGTLTVDDVIDANGGAPSHGASGGGAGGSLWIECTELVGTGLVQANGYGVAGNGGGGGSGGRVAVYTEMPFPPEMEFSAFGGLTNSPGAAGTVYLQPAAGQGLLIIDNNGVDAVAATVFNGPVEVFAMSLRSSARVAPEKVLDNPGTQLQIATESDLLIESSSIITATARGFSTNDGPGAGESVGSTSTGRGGGGGHGGRGGTSQRPSNFGEGGGGTSYGDPNFPSTRGSGAGSGPGGGGDGGGYIRLDVGGTLLLDGSIEANGATDSGTAAGGAGGGILITAEAIQGAGTIDARGADGDSGGGGPNCTGSGGGGGGLIAIYACSIDPAIEYSAAAGAGCDPGETSAPVVEGNYVASSPPSFFAFMSGEDATLTADAAVPGGTFQWIRDGVPLADGPTGTGSSILGSNTRTLVLENVGEADAGLYQVAVSGTCTPLTRRTFVVVVDGSGGDVCPVDVNGDGQIDTDDLYFIHQNPTDINGDGVADDEDKRCLERYLRRSELEDMTNGRR